MAIYRLKYDTHETHIMILGYLKILFVFSVSHDLPWLNINMSSTMFDMAQAYFGTLCMPNFDPDQCHSMSFIHQHAYRGLIRRGGWRLGRQLFGETDSAALPLSVVGMQSKLSFQAQVADSTLNSQDTNSSTQVHTLLSFPHLQKWFEKSSSENHSDVGAAWGWVAYPSQFGLRGAQ